MSTKTTVKTGGNLRRLNTHEISPQEHEFRAFMETRLVGQPEAIDALARAYRAAFNPVRNPFAPLSTLLFIGPSRSGKSHSVSLAADFCHGDPEAMVELEGGELQKEHEVLKLVGAPPSYLGYKKPPEDGDDSLERLGGKEKQPVKIDPSAKLAPENLEASRKGSSCPIVWIRINEIEKAHKALFDLLLGATDNGKINLGNNRTVSLRNCIIVMTSNLGMAELQRKPIGFVLRQQTTVEDVKSVVDKAMEGEFRPEFRNRIDETVVFHPLTPEQVRKVVDVEVGRIQDRITNNASGQMFVLDVDDEAKDFILARSDSSAGGVADMKRTLKHLLEEPLGNELLKHTINLGDRVVVTHEEGSDELAFFVDADGALLVKTARERRLRHAVVLAGDDLAELQDESAALVHDLEEVFGMTVEEFTYRKAAPYALKATVLATEQQVKALKVKYPSVKVTCLESPEGDEREAVA